ncbi:MAG: hypothetical protein JWO96_405 [Candidatus Saccharibacteria bacterium]|nr:hypothetical protein [Candidatus Saccharibacteria bacterium]
MIRKKRVSTCVRLGSSVTLDVSKRKLSIPRPVAEMMGWSPEGPFVYAEREGNHAVVLYERDDPSRRIHIIEVQG